MKTVSDQTFMIKTNLRKESHFLLNCIDRRCTFSVFISKYATAEERSPQTPKDLYILKCVSHPVKLFQMFLEHSTANHSRNMKQIFPTVFFSVTHHFQVAPVFSSWSLQPSLKLIHLSKSLKF